MHIGGTLTRLRALGLCLRFFASSMVPGSAVATNEAGDSLGVDILAIDSECRLFALSGTLLLLPEHQMNLLCLDVLAYMPCGETIFVLLFSDGSGVRRCEQESFPDRKRE